MRFRSFFEPAKCPYCGAAQTAHLAVSDDARPECGDVSICADCAQISEYDEHLQMVVPAAERLARLKADPELIRVQQAVRAARAAL